MNAQVKNVEVKTVEDDLPCVMDVLYTMEEKLVSEEYMISQIRHSVISLKDYGVHANFLINLLKELTILEQLNYDNANFVKGEIKKTT